MATTAYAFDRFLTYNDMTEWLQNIAAEHPNLVTLSSYGTSFEGRHLWLATITDTSTGAAEHKPAHWVDANIHAVEVTGGVAALHLIHHLVSGHVAGDADVVDALRTRTFYVAPRVNPDGVEAALGDRPYFVRSSVRPWPWRDGHRWPGLLTHEDIDGDGRVLTMRVKDEHGAWVEHPSDARVMIPVDHADAPRGAQRYRVLSEGTIADYDGFTIPQPRNPRGLDMNRNFPAGWDPGTRGAGDHPMSEPEIDALVRAITARPNICGYNAYHTSGGILLRPSSMKADSALPPEDLWVYNEIGRACTDLSTYPVYSVYESFTWDKSNVMSGAADDWVYEHLGLVGWTTEFWDAVAAATNERSSTHIWYLGPTVEQELAVAKWSDTHAPGSYVQWYSFDHPQLGAVELGGADMFRIWTNAPTSKLLDEVAPHSRFAVHQALKSPKLEILLADAKQLGDDTWLVRVGVANTGWLPTYITTYANKHNLVLPLTVDITGATPIGEGSRKKLGQLEGRVALRMNGGAMSDGTGDRALATWTVKATRGTTVNVVAEHPRAGHVTTSITLS